MHVVSSNGANCQSKRQHQNATSPIIVTKFQQPDNAGQRAMINTNYATVYDNVVTAL